jgi:hypothetical protein
MKRLTLRKNRSDEAFNASSLHCQKNSAKVSNTYVKAKTTMFFGFVTETMEIKFFWEIAHGIHRFITSKR